MVQYAYIDPCIDICMYMNKVSIGIVAAMVFVGVLFVGGLQSHVLASNESNGKRYNDGFNNGFDAAQNANFYDSTCDPNKQYTSDGLHSFAYCDGWHNGYNAAWAQRNNNNNSNNNNQGGNQQSSDVNIHGNNNKVEVNQGQSQDSGNAFSPDNQNGYNPGGNNPTCRIICIS